MSVRVGTCSWADESLSKLWYPPGVSSAEARLRWYAEHFDTVEVNSSYYALPTEEMATAWAHRTPPGFVFHVKAFGMMTRHPVRVEQLPPDMRSEAEFDERGRIDRPSQELRSAVFRRFLRAVEPLREAGKLGGVLMQLPQYVVFKPSSFAYLEWAREQLTDHHMLVEFRHRSWLTDEHREQTLAFLERLPASYVIVDAPPVTSDNVAPTVVARTSDTAYLRLHGRNTATWNHRGGGAAKRFDYLYSQDELAEWVEPLRRAGRKRGRGVRDVQQQRPQHRRQRPAVRPGTGQRRAAVGAAGRVVEAGRGRPVNLGRAYRAAGGRHAGPVKPALATGGHGCLRRGLSRGLISSVAATVPRILLWKIGAAAVVPSGPESQPDHVPSSPMSASLSR